MEILCGEVVKYIVWVGPTEVHLDNEEDMLKFVAANEKNVTDIQKVMRGVVTN